MWITPEEHAQYQRSVVCQVAGRLGLTEPNLYTDSDLLFRIEAIDYEVLLAMQQFRTTYRTWYAKAQEVERLVNENKDATVARIEVTELRKRRDHERNLLVRLLDLRYPAHSSSNSGV